MSAESPQPVAHHFDRPSGRLRRMLQQARRLQRLDQQLRARLPSPLKHHCQAANDPQQTLIVLVDSPAWASRLRFHAPELLSQLRNHRGQRFHELKIRVRRPDYTDDRRPPRPPLRISEQSAAAILGTAAGIRDPALRAALRRLARHLSPQTPEP
jgi:hypothetical protein